MQLRFDGRIGFPGGFVDDSEDLEMAINREVVEELGKTSEPVNIIKDDYVISHLFEEHVPELDLTKKLCLHFFAKKVPLGQFLELEKRKPDAPNLGYEVSFRAKFLLKFCFILTVTLIHCAVLNQLSLILTYRHYYS